MVASLLFASTTPVAAGPPPVLTVYVPIPEDDIQSALAAMAATSQYTIGPDIQTIISITVAADGGLIYYDHWEDGYEADIANPVQPSTEVWGDNDASNGIPPGYATDVIGAGSVLVLDNGSTLTVPRHTTANPPVAFDARDKVASDRGFALTRAGWEDTYGTLHAGAIAAYDTSRFGTSFEFPIGEDVASDSAFEYTALSVMAASDGTSLTIDIDGDGTFETNTTLDEGETAFIDGGIQSGGTLRTSHPVQAALLTGDVGATFEGRWFELFPMELLSDNYVAATGTTEATNEPVIFLYNPALFDITVDVTRSGGVDQVVVPSKTAVSYLMPNGSGGNFSSVGAPFFALSATGALADSGSAASSSENDWGYALVPESLLTAGVVVGWGPGSWQPPSGTQTQNMSPVWVAALADTTLNIDYDNDGTVDATQPVTAFESVALYDGGDNDMTGAAIFTTDGTRITASWGQDPATASPGTPALDLGSAVVPSTVLIVDKSAELTGDVAGDGVVNPGDTVHFTIDVFDASALSLTNVTTVDDLAAEFDYVDNSTEFNGVPLPDDLIGTPFPLDGTGHVVPTMAPGSSVRYEFDARITGAWPDTAIGTTNTVITTALEGDGVDTVGIPVELDDLAISKSGPTDPVSPGETITYTIDVTNLGASAQTNVTIGDVLPSEVDFVSASLTVPSPGSGGFVLDATDVASFSNDDGSLSWAGPWAEVDNQGAGPTNGSIRFLTSGGANGGGYFRLRNANNSMTRGIDTTNYDEGTLSLEFSRRSMSFNDSVALEVSSDGGGSWTELRTFAGPADDPGYLNYTTDISAHLGGDFQLRFVSNGSMNNGDSVYFSDLRIDLVSRDVITTDAGTGPTFASGVTLLPYETATVEIVATVNATAAGLQFFDNIATASSTTDGPLEAPVRTFVALGSLGDTIFADDDGDGTQDAGEPGLVGVTVELLDGTGTVIATDVTNASGLYAFEGLAAGNYSVRVDTSTLPADTTTLTADPDATPDGESSVTLGVGVDIDTLDFGFQPLGTIGDTVWADDDGDGVEDAGEFGIAGVTVELLNGTGTVIDTDVTDAGGVYGFADLVTGSYSVRVDTSTLPVNATTATADRDGSLDDETAIALAAGEDVSDADFGYQPVGAIGDRVWADDDGDGVEDAGESGIAGVTVELLDGTGTVIGTDVTDASGAYLFTGLGAGTYSVRVDTSTLPADTTTQSGDPDTTLDGEGSATLLAGTADLGLDFGYQPLGTIGDTVYSDVDGNGTQDAGEPGLVGVTVELLDGTGTVIDTDVTDGSGVYGFADLPAGDYTVRVNASTLPADTTTATADRDATADGETDITLAGGEDVTDADFGYQPLGSIGDRVWSDDDGDGVQDAGEPGLSGVTVELLNGTGTVIGTDVTDGTGDYGFADLPAGSYTVRVDTSTLPADTTSQTGDRDATLDDETTLTLAAGEDVADADFGYQPLGTIGDTVYSDVDGDGTQDAGEPGLSGVTVELLDAVGTVIATDVTDGTGDYGFADLAAGDYTVRVDTTTLPSGVTQTDDRDATLDDETSLTLSAGQDVSDADFGYEPAPPGSIGDRVWSDVDGDGVQDAGEPGLAGVTVELLDGTGTVIATATTDLSGNYSFTDLPAASYSVRVDVSTLPADTTTQTGDPDATLDDTTSVTLDHGDNVATADFGYQPLGTIGDRVWSDVDGDGVQDAGEPGLSGVTVELLDGTGTVIGTDVTDGTGDYGFADLAADSYTVRVDTSTLPGDTTTQTGDRDATLDDETTIALAGGADITNADFGYQPLGTIGDTVYSDVDGDGVQDAGEPGLSGVTVELLDGTGTVIGTDVTDASGLYGFADLPAESYTVRVDTSTLPAGVTQTDDPDATVDDETTLTLAAGEDVTTADFGYEPPVLATLGDTIFNDQNGDGVQDATDPGLAGVTVELLDGTGTVIATDVTDAAGNYLFPGLTAGTYTVRVDTSTLPFADIVLTYDPEGVEDHEAVGTVDFGDTFLHIDFGYMPFGSIGDTVFADVDGDGVQDAGEPGIPGVTVEVLDSTGTTVYATETTDATGSYTFAGVPMGNFIVRVDTSTLPADTTTQTADPDATLDDEHPVALGAGEDIDTVDFGYQPLGTIGDTVYSDVDGDGTQDAGEPGLSGVTVELLNGTGTVIDSDVTDGTGDYGFADLPAGSYSIRVDTSTLPAGVTQTADRDATLDDETAIALAAGQDVSDADFGYEPPVLATIGDTVFADENGSGVQGAGEPGIPGVTVELLDGTGTVIATDVTDASGVYGFTDLTAGTYTVRVDTSTLPSDTTTQTADPDATLDDASSVTLAFGDNVTTVDFGYQPLGTIGDRVWADLDGDGIQDAGEPGLSGVTVELLDGTGTVIGSDVTDASGAYGFGTLPADDYTVRVDVSTLPADTTTQTGDPDATLDDETDITLAAGQDVTDADFGYQPLGTIGDTVYSDVDGNGAFGAGDSGLSGVTVELLNSSGTVIGTDVADASGVYGFADLPAADYTVRVDTSTLPAGMTQTDDRDATLDDETDITLAAGQDVSDADFGYEPPVLSSIGDRVWADADGDGVQDAGEPGVPGVTVELLDGTGTVVATDVTDGTGLYGFAGLTAGTYTVRVDTSTLPADTTTQTGDRDATLDDETAITLGFATDITNADFGYQPLGTIGDRVWADLDGDGIQDVGEPGLSGVTVELLDAVGTVIASDVTDGAGAYTFSDLVADDYTVRVDTSTVPVDTTTQTGDPDATIDGETSLTLAAGDDITTADFGFQPLGSIGDTVYSDVDGDGTQDAGEPGLSGVTVELLDAVGTVIATDVTDTAGDYGFVDLPAGDYTVRVEASTLPGGVTQTDDRDATLDDETTITLAGGADITNADFGYEPAPLGSIGDRVWSDDDGDGIQDAGEPGLAGVTVELLDGTGTVIASDVTDASGDYGFAGLTAGTYTVRVDSSTLPGDTTTQTGDRDATLDDETMITLGFGTDVTDADFGYQPLGTIGDTVYSDTDGDGVQDAGEPGLASVTVELLNGTGVVIATDVTDAAGDYGFADLPAADYTVRVDGSTLPAGVTQTDDRDAILDDETDITLAAGEDVSDADFGYEPPVLASVGDRVWSDLDGDGVQDAGEPGLSGVTVELLDGTGTVIATDVTNVSGVYTFTDLAAGSYSVRVDTSTLPADTTTQTGDPDATLDSASSVTLAFGDNVNTVDFGYQPLGTIGDRVWADVDGDGTQDAGEPGLSGVTVELLDAVGTVIGTDVTDGTGDYGFAGLPADDYTVRVDTSTLPADTTTQTGDRDATLDDETDITLAGGADVTNADFGYQPLGTIGDTVYSDVDGDGVQDAGEPGLSGVTVELLDAVGTVIASDVTDASGVYGFTGLAADDYTVRVDASTLPAGVTQTDDRDATLDDETDITLAAGDDIVDADFGYEPAAPSSIGDTVFADVDGDGTQDAGDSGIAGVTVELLDAVGTVIASDVTDASGVYGFTGLAAGDYTVRVDTSTLPADTTTQTADRDASLDGETSVTLGFGTDIVDADFGYQPLGSIGDRVWSDVDGDGTQDAGEPGLSGVTVELLDGTGTVITSDVTDGTGDYGFTGLAVGDYTVRVDTSTLPADTTTQTGDRDATLDDETDITLAAGADVTDADFGYQPLGSIGDRVWSDVDGDGIQDAGEPGLAGVTVELLDAVGTVIGADVTDGSGDYTFTGLAAGDYSVRVDASTLPAGVTQTGDRDATLDDETAITLTAGADVTDADFGYQPLGSIGDTVFADVDGDGTQDAGEPGLSGVTVELLDAVGTVVATDTTDGTGAYGFTDLPADDYSVRVDTSTLPADTTTQTGDRDATLDDETAITLTAGADVTDADFGYQPLGTIGDRVWSDTDADGIQDAGEPGLSGVTVELLDGTGTVIASDVTDGAGNYAFAGLAAGAYTVRVDVSTLPTGVIQTGDPDATLDDESTLTLAAGEDVTTADFGYQPLGSIGDLVYSDADGNGAFSPGDSGLSGVTVELLDAVGTVISTDTTDGAGNYAFTDLPSGSYTVRVDASTLPAGVTQTDDRDATFDDETTITLAGGADIVDADFGYEPPAPLGSIGDTVFADVDGDGVQDAGDNGIAGVTVELLDGTGTVIATTITSLSGTYSFSGLAAGDYSVRVDTSTLPADTTTQTADRDATLDDETAITLAAGEDVTDADFGYQPLGSIGDRVWSDLDGDGIQDAGEPGLSGVTVELLDGTGTVIATTITSLSGTYSFSGLAAGDYSVRIDTSSLPANTSTQTGDPDATLDDETAITLAAGEDVTDADFGYQPLGLIGDRVWSDLDGDGVQDAGEPGLSGVTVELLDAVGTVIASDVTDGVGAYSFTGLAADDYSVRVDVSTLPANTSTQTGDPDATLDDETDITLAAGADVTDADFGYQPLGSIGDTVFADVDGDGTQDAGDPGLSGVTVELLSAVGTVIGSDLTDGAGAYSFTGLAADDYTVRIDTSTLPADTTTQTADRDATLDDETAITLTAGADIVDADFGYQPLGTIGDRVWSDLDGDGIQDAGEPGLSGVTVELLDAVGTVVATDTTDGAGAYSFAGLTAGDYTVRVDTSTLPANTTTQTGDPDATIDGETAITLAAGDDITTADFGYQPLGSIGDTVFADVDGDGIQDAGELGLSGVTVELLDGTGTVIGSDVTDGTGDYSFTGLAGAAYTVRVDTSTLPADTTTQTADRDATLDDETAITLTAGTDIVDADFGYQPLGTIGDLVYSDADGSGAFNLGDSGLSGVTVELLDGTGTVIATDVTDGAGNYAFAGLEAGAYTVRVDASTLPAGVTQTDDRDATLDDETSITLAAGEDVSDADFGYEPPAPLGSIGDTVFADVDGDGTQDPGDSGIAGVTVELLDGTDTVVATTITSLSGAYSFTGLTAGDYTVRVDTSTLPADTTTQTADRDATLDDETAITLTAGTDVTDADFGYQPVGTIGDTVFADVDGDGTQDPGDSGIAGVTVELLDGAGTVIGSDVTDATGDYGFTGLPAGDYTVRIDAGTLPADTTTQTADRDATADGQTTVTLAAAGTIDDADFGYQPLGTIGDTVYADDNGNGAQDGAESGIAGVTVELLDGAGTVIATDVTDAAGDYGFAGLPAGDYTVRVDSGTLPAGVVPTDDPDGTLDHETAITLAAGSDITDADFGYQALSSIGDTVFADDNGNGAQDGAEAGIAGVTVELLNGTGTVIASTATDGAGNYAFVGLGAGTYTVRVDTGTLPADTTTQTADRDATLDDETAITLAAGTDVTDADFGYQPLGTIGDTVYSDENGDGVDDAVEPGLAGVTVELLNGAGTVIASTATDAAGNYTFAGLPAGTYTVRVDASTLPAGVTQTDDRDGSFDHETAITLAAGADVVDADFGYEPPAPLGTIGDRVFADIDGNGVDDTEPGIAGVTVNVFDGTGTVVGTSVTDATGAWAVGGLPAGTYDVQVDTSTLPADTTTQTMDRDGTLDDATSVVLAPGGIVTDADFGYQPLGTIGDLVFADIDGNGTFDGADTPLVGVTVELLDGTGTVVDSTTTDAAGLYTFTDVPAGTWTVQVDSSTLPADTTTVTADPDAIDDGLHALVLGGGEDRTDIDFGYQPLGSVDATVWADVDGDGTFDGGESPLVGVTVELLDGTGSVVATAATDAAGLVSFTGLPAGDYSTRVDASTLPANTTTQTGDPDATLDGLTAFTLAPGEDRTGDEFGYQPLGTIGDLVYTDVAGNGTFDGADTGIAGVTVELLDGTGTVIATTTTDGAGAYAFTGVAAGDHTVRIVSATLPSNVTTPSADRDATLDGQTTVTVPAGGVIDDADFGYEPDPTTGSIVVEVFADIDGNATQDGADPDLSGVTVELLDNSGTVVATGVTAADGTFTFSGVLAGDYTTRVDTSTLPADTTTLTADPDATADSSHPLTLVAGTTDTSSVYGYQPLGSVDATVWADVDGDGTFDGGESPLVGVSVELLDGTGSVVATAATDAAGLVSFTGLPAGDYSTRVDASTLPANTTTQTGDPDATLDGLTAFTLAPGEDRTGDEFGYQPLAAIDGTVFDDVDGDSTQNGTEPGLAGVTVELLDATGTVIATTTTDPAGAYAFTGLPDAGYTVRIDASTLPASMVQTADPDPTLDGRTPATITGSVDVTGLDFGYRTPPPAPGTIASGVWLDENGDGVQDAGEPPIPGVRVELVDAAGIVIGSTTTAADGSLGFVNVPPGDYTLRVDETTLPAGVTSRTADADGTLDAETPVTVTAGSPSVVTDFGYEPDPTALGAIDGVIFHDVDGDSVRQPGEPVMSQVTVILRDAAGVEVARMLTLADGSYRFDDLPLGTYIVEVEPPVGFTITPQTTAPDGSVIDSSGRVVVVVASVDTVETAFGGLQLLSAQTTNTTTTTQPTTSTTIGTTTTTTSSGTIAYTGSSTGVIVGAGVALLAAGWFALIVARRREDETEQA